MAHDIDIVTEMLTDDHREMGVVATRETDQVEMMGMEKTMTGNPQVDITVIIVAEVGMIDHVKGDITGMTNMRMVRVVGTIEIGTMMMHMNLKGVVETKMRWNPSLETRSRPHRCGKGFKLLVFMLIA